MHLAPGLEMPLTDLFIISPVFPQECIENYFSCSEKEIKWAVSAALKTFRDENRCTDTHKYTRGMAAGGFFCPQ